MSTGFQDVAAAIKGLLLAGPALAGGRVRVNPSTPMAAEHASGVAVRMDATTLLESSTCARLWQTAYVVELAARGAPGADPAEAVDALLQEAEARIQAADLSAAGVQSLVDGMQIDWQYDVVDTPVATAVLRLSVQHFTERATLAAAPIT